MRSDVPRREALQALTAAFAGGVAGCSGLVGGDGSPGTDVTSDGCGGTTPEDAGNDAYGVLIHNRLTDTLEVTITVQEAWGDEEVWNVETSVEGGGGCKEWDNVITGEKEYAVTAEMGHVRGPQHDSSRLYITPGADNAPAVENIAVILEIRQIGCCDEGPWIAATDDPEKIPETECDDAC